MVVIPSSVFRQGVNTQPSIVLAIATLRQDGESRRVVQGADLNQPQARSFAVNNASENSGIGKRATGGRIGKRNTQRRNWQSSRNLAGNVLIAALPMAAFWKWIISILRRNSAHHTGCTQRRSEFVYGGAKWIICKYSARIATASRHGLRRGLERIAAAPKSSRICSSRKSQNRRS